MGCLVAFTNEQALLQPTRVHDVKNTPRVVARMKADCAELEAFFAREMEAGALGALRSRKQLAALLAAIPALIAAIEWICRVPGADVQKRDTASALVGEFYGGASPVIQLLAQIFTGAHVSLCDALVDAVALACSSDVSGTKGHKGVCIPAAGEPLSTCVCFSIP